MKIMPGASTDCGRVEVGLNDQERKRINITLIILRAAARLALHLSPYTA